MNWYRVQWLTVSDVREWILIYTSDSRRALSLALRRYMPSVAHSVKISIVG